MSWRQVRLGDYISIKHGYAFKSKYFGNSGEYILLTPGNFHERGGLKLRGEREKYFVGDIPEESILQEGDLIVVMTDLVQTAPILGGALIIPDNDRFLHNQRLGLVTIENAKVLNKDFLFYVLNSDYYRAQVRGSATGATVRHTAPKRIYGCQIKIPEYEEQSLIAALLRNYDDLIENNRRRIMLLEQAARLLYREWFVYFRFPGHEHVKITDGVPEGWKSVNVPDIVAINPKERLEKASAIRYVPMSCLSETGMTVSMGEVGLREKATGVRFRNGDTLLARITPCLENGKTAYVNLLNSDEVACGSTEFIVLRGIRVSPYFVYCLARTHDFRENAVKSMIGSSGRQRVQVSCFDEFGLSLPPRLLADQFDEFASYCFDEIANLHKQNEHLARARDLLLPRLMNGELVI